jgi:hypothetical protein
VKKNGRKLAGQKKIERTVHMERQKIYYMGHMKFRDNFGAFGKCRNL